MLTLLSMAFLPMLGLRFDWLSIHWKAGVVLVMAILFHVVHAVFWMDFASIWPTPSDFRESKPGKYPLANKLFHLAALAAALCSAATGGLMLFKVPTPLFERNPYLLGDMAWGVVYVLHGLAGAGLVALVLVHIYFGLRPDNRPILQAMVTGGMDREAYLARHDPKDWACGNQSSPS